MHIVLDSHVYGWRDAAGHNPVPQLFPKNDQIRLAVGMFTHSFDGYDPSTGVKYVMLPTLDPHHGRLASAVGFLGKQWDGGGFSQRKTPDLAELLVPKITRHGISQPILSTWWFMFLFSPMFGMVDLPISTSYVTF